MNSSEYVLLPPETFTQTTSYSLKHFYHAKSERTTHCKKQNDTILSIFSISTKNTEKEERNDLDYSISDISEFDLDNSDY